MVIYRTRIRTQLELCHILSYLPTWLLCSCAVTLEPGFNNNALHLSSRRLACYVRCEPSHTSTPNRGGRGRAGVVRGSGNLSPSITNGNP